MGVYKRGETYWYEFVFNGERVRESTKQGNKRVAEQMEAARRTQLAKGEVGLRDRSVIPTLKEFAERDFKPFIEPRFRNKPKTLEYYLNGVKNISAFAPLRVCTLDKVTADKIAGFIAKRREAGLQVSSINRQLEVMRRMLKLATEWGKVDRALPKVEMLSGENHRDRVLSADEEIRYLLAATAIGEAIQQSYRRALEGIRATSRGEQPSPPEDPFLLRDVATVLIDCGLRPEECFRLQWEDVRDGAIHVPFGKTENARRTIPLTQRAAALIEMRCGAATTRWLFPAHTRSGHIEKSTLKKQHPKACRFADTPAFPLYTFRHTCLTRWAAHMDPFTLAYLAGHSDFSTTKRYVHPQAQTVREAIERARVAQSPHKSPHIPESTAESSHLAPAQSIDCGGGYLVGASGFEPPTSWSRTRRSSQAEPRPEHLQSIRVNP
jgi:integrase